MVNIAAVEALAVLERSAVTPRDSAERDGLFRAFRMLYRISGAGEFGGAGGDSEADPDA